MDNTARTTHNLLTVKAKTRYTDTMNILRNFLIGLMRFTCITALSGFIYLLTLQTTVMDRMVVKNWLNESGIYDGKLLTALLQTGDTQTTQPEAAAAITPSTDAIKTSLNATFTPEFTKTHIEQIIDSTYDWAEGKSPTLSFSVPIDEKRETFVQSLSRALEPQIAALPVCQSVAAAQEGAVVQLDAQAIAVQAGDFQVVVQVAGQRPVGGAHGGPRACLVGAHPA